MFAKICKLIQPSVIVVWPVILYNFISPFPGVWNTVAMYAVIILAFGHLGEWFVVKARLAALGHQGLNAFFKVMVFGFTWCVCVDTG